MGDREARMRNRLSVKKLGVGLAGLDGVNQKVPLATTTKTLLINALKNSGCVKITVTGDALVGKQVKTAGLSTWGEKLDSMAEHLKENEPSYFVLFRSAQNCLIVTYVPDNAKPFFKMLYASSKESVKDALILLDPEMDLEEFNVAEISDLTFASYEKKNNAPKPYSEQEILRQEQEAQPTSGGYGVLARIMAMQKGEVTNRDVIGGDADAKPQALPGMFGPGGIGAIKLKPIGKTKIKKKVDITQPKKMELKSFDKIKLPPVNEKLKAKVKEVAPVEASSQAVEDDAQSVEILIKAGPGEDFEPGMVIEPPPPPVEEVPEEEEPEVEEEIGPPPPEEEEDFGLRAPPASKKSSEKYDLPPMTSQPLIDEDQIIAEAPPVETIQKPPPNEAISGLVDRANPRQPSMAKGPGLIGRISRLFRSKKSKPPKLTPEEIAELDNSDGQYSIADLREMKRTKQFGELNPKALEEYLSTREFSQLTGYSKSVFYGLKSKQQNKIRRKMGI